MHPLDSFWIKGNPKPGTLQVLLPSNETTGDREITEDENSTEFGGKLQTAHNCIAKLCNYFQIDQLIFTRPPFWED